MLWLYGWCLRSASGLLPVCLASSGLCIFRVLDCMSSQECPNRSNATESHWLVGEAIAASMHCCACGVLDAGAGQHKCFYRLMDLALLFVLAGDVQGSPYMHAAFAD